jgi:hypothetical protein
MAMKGQASLEYLLVTIVAVSMLIISASALYGIREMAVQGAAAAAFRSQAAMMADAGNEVCALGDGNGRELSLAQAVSVESEKDEEGYLARYAGAGNVTLVRPCRCAVEETKGLSGLVYLENEDGKIKIRER